MTCNKVDGIFSWQGQASLGGYIGADSASFFSSVVSGAAGTYMATITHDAMITTDLSVERGVLSPSPVSTLPAQCTGTCRIVTSMVACLGRVVSMHSTMERGRGVMVIRTPQVTHLTARPRFQNISVGTTGSCPQRSSDDDGRIDGIGEGQF
jgi:hypothetical protein